MKKQARALCDKEGEEEGVIIIVVINNNVVVVFFPTLVR